MNLESKIVSIVVRNLEANPEWVKDSSQKRERVQLRQAVCYYCYFHLRNLTLRQISNIIGRDNHSIVKSSVESWNELIITNRMLRIKHHLIEKEIEKEWQSLA